VRHGSTLFRQEALDSLPNGVCNVLLARPVALSLLKALSVIHRARGRLVGFLDHDSLRREARDVYERCRRVYGVRTVNPQGD